MMAATSSLLGLVLATLSGLVLVSAQAIPAPDLPYTFDHPYQQKAKSNGLAVEKPNIIIFMPDQLRLDSVGAFGSDVSIHGDLANSTKSPSANTDGMLKRL
jgi:hypothetical protein